MVSYLVILPLAVLCVADFLGVSFEDVRDGLAAFQGVDRRFSVRGEFTGPGTFDVRFRYRGGPASAWWSTRSRAIVIKVS